MKRWRMYLAAVTLSVATGTDGQGVGWGFLRAALCMVACAALVDEAQR